MARKLPLGIQDFVKIRENGYCYVDKTERIYQLISGSSEVFFLSRPRRFGKSLLCSALGAIFEGRRELFGEIAGKPPLAINSLDWEWKKHPVIRLDLNPGNYAEGTSELFDTINRCLELCAEKYEVPFTGKTASDRFARLIYALRKHYDERVAVIVDEYDKPLLNTIDVPDIHIKIRDELKSFYGILKSSDEYLRFVFFTGVTKFAHISIFSGLNHLKDITLNPAYADLCGITQDELEHDFVPEIDSVLHEKNKDRKTYLDELRHFYNGYRFSRKELTVYNPFGLLNHFDREGDFLPYWYETGTPTFLIKLIAEQKIDILNLNKLKVAYADFSQYDTAGMKAEPVLYQSGYLTITDYDEEHNEFALDYPNVEVRASFANSLMEQYFQAPYKNSRMLTSDLIHAFVDGRPEDALQAVRVFLSKIPYDLIKEKENYYQTAIHLIFTMLGLNCRSEARIASGRIDTLVETKKYVYCFEFKLNGTADEALKQIDTKEYMLPWMGTGKKLFKAGVNFDHSKNNIDCCKIASVL